MALALRYAASSDIGLIRKSNQDSAYAGPRLLVVADGMGGHVGGDVASSVAVAQLSPLDEDPPGSDLLDRLAGAVSDANYTLREMVQGDPALEGMGTTLTALLRAGSKLGLAHVGDSRCYLLRGGELTQITRDHTFVQGLVDDGRITAEQADHHPQRSLLLRALDGRTEVEVDLSVREAREGDRYLLCSDGLSGVVSEETITEALGQGTPEQAVATLVELALRGGGPDNVTAVVADVVDIEAAPSDIPTVVGAAALTDGDRGTRSDSAAGRAAALSPPRQDTTEAGSASPEGRGAGWVRRMALLGVAAVLLGVVGWSAYAWSQQQFFVGADGSGEVTIYRGLAQQLGPLQVSSVFEAQDIDVAELPEFAHRLVSETIPAQDLAEARTIVSSLRDQVELCEQARESALRLALTGQSVPGGLERRSSGCERTAR